MQAVGMTKWQMFTMLMSEGMFFTVGTFLVTTVFGSVLGYLAFLYAKSIALFRIRSFIYPKETVIMIAVALFLIQLCMGGLLSGTVKKESLIDRIRFSE